MRLSPRLSWLYTATLSLTIAACSGGGGAGNGDEDAGNNGTGDGGDNAASTGDGGDNATGDGGDNTGSTGDGGDSTGDGGDTTGGANDGFSCAGAATTIVAGAGGSVASDDSGAFVLSFAPNALTADTAIKVCAVPTDQVPSALGADGTGPVSTVYRVEPATLPLAASANATSALTLSSAVLTAITSGDEVAPLLLRAAADTGAPSTLNGTVMRGALPASGSLHGVHGAGGYVYARHLDAAGIRHRAKVVLPAATALTGELIQVGMRVSVVGTPTIPLDLGLRTVGCDLEPIAFSGTEQAHTRDEAFGCEAEPIDWASADVVTGGASLTTGAVVDLTVGGSDVDATHSPPTFVCTHSGTARAEVQLRFLAAGGTTPLTTLVGTQDIACTWSGDRVVAANYETMTRLSYGPIVPTVAPFGAPLPQHEVAFTTNAYRQAVVALGSDGFYYKNVSATRSETLASSLKLIAPSNTGTLASSDGYGAATYTAATIANKEATDPNTAPIDIQYFSKAGGTLRVERETNAGAVEVSAAGSSAINVAFGSPDGRNTTVSFADGSADTIYIRGLIRQNATATGAIQPDGYARWLRASDLPLAGGRRSFTVLTADQDQTITTAAIALTHYQVAFLKTNWDERRTFWPMGRVVPISGGVVYQVSASRLDAAPLAGPCPTSVQTGTNTACKAGPNEVLAVAVGGKVELFSPIDGRYLRTLVQAGASAPDGFVQMVQSQSDHCLYATQQTTSLNDGIWRYGADGSLLSSSAVLTSGGLTPAGALNQGPNLFVANEQGGIALIDATAATPIISTTFDASSFARGITASTTGDLYLSDVATGAADGRIRSIAASNQAVTTFLSNLTQPRQVALDFANTPNLLVALAGEHAIGAYAFAGAGVVRYVDELYSGAQQPVGVWPLLNEHWLVAGDGIGVDVVMPGSHVRTAESTTITQNAAQISRLCLP